MDNLPWSVAGEDLVNFFSSYGEIENGRVFMNRKSGHSRGLSFVTFTAEVTAEAALKADAAEQKSRSPIGRAGNRHEEPGHY